MALKIPVPEVSWGEVQVALGGLTYNFVYRYNSTDKRFRLDIYQNEEPVILGIKLIEGGGNLKRYSLTSFDHGELFCIRAKKTTQQAQLGNLGVGKDYELTYYTNREVLSILEES